MTEEFHKLLFNWEYDGLTEEDIKKIDTVLKFFDETLMKIPTLRKSFLKNHPEFKDFYKRMER